MEPAEKEFKCIVWDLDNTLWDGILSEGDLVILKPGIRDIIVELDRRGILHSIASKNNAEDVMRKLEEFNLTEYFLYPQIHWNSKSESVQRIKQQLNISFDTMLFIDDQPFERDEVKYGCGEVTTMDADEYSTMLQHPRLIPRFITEDSVRRRQMYREDSQRNTDEQKHNGTAEDFLASLNLEFIITEAQTEDLKRAEELTIRTNQLNATGRTYSYDELQGFIHSDQHKLYICELTDRYGSYGKIGLALVQVEDEFWCLNLLLMSCRVMSRSVGSVLLTYILERAASEGKILRAHFRQTDRNKQMYVTYRFSNFTEIENDQNGNILMEYTGAKLPKYPSYITLYTPEMMSALKEI